MAERQSTIIRIAFFGFILGAVALFAGVYYWRFLSPEPMSALLRRIPTKDSVVLQVDLRALRMAGLLSALSSSAVVEEEEYRRFVHETAFDYKTDLDSVILSYFGDDRLALASGRFDLPALKKYVMVHGGNCRNGLCSLKTARGDRFVSFVPLRSNLVAWASSKDELGAYQMMGTLKPAVVPAPPNAPFWMSVPRSYWKNPRELPSGTKLFAKALEDADTSIFSLSAANGSLEALLEAYCGNESTANSLQTQLNGITDVFRKYMERVNQNPGAADLGGLLINGKFEKQATKVTGRWPLDKQFLEALIGGRI